MKKPAPTHLFCIGAQKAGTTWLADYLSKHPEAFVPGVKEVDFFSALAFGDQKIQMMRRLALLREELKVHADGSIIPNFHTDWVAETCHVVAALSGKADYMSLYNHLPPQVQVSCDISPSYSLLSRSSYSDMLSRHPDPRFIFLMRDPIDRFWSSVRMYYASLAAQNTTLSIETVFNEFIDRPDDHLCLFTRYDMVLRELEAAVPQDRIHYVFYEDLFGPDGSAVLKRITDFLDISFMDTDLGRRVWETDTEKVSKTAMTVEMHNSARELFNDVYVAVKSRFGDAAPKSWHWDPEAMSSTKTPQSTAVEG